MIRRVAIALATVTVAGFMAAAPAAATSSPEVEAAELGGGYFQVDGSHASGEFLNLGGPYGITYAQGSEAHLHAEGAEFYARYLHSR
ncbi:hypothetical protein GT204_12330 [Streptomyces sp. SID4919]|uniref:hypothetical protein n=1 Tax=unclassified Streptomyces TaxID=2593676 RepID=UPI000823EBC0|nr:MULTISPECIES: hypothetical protein [unclassified Streptomyces]MYY09676.1 hypothetical protein [Streptomyces sp. SID4919]SCK35469.1 hypothetical protein YW7DRAFT_02931 [Streptomyces sp. AmelKG-E11A]